MLRISFYDYTRFQYIQIHTSAFALLFWVWCHRPIQIWKFWKSFQPRHYPNNFLSTHTLLQLQGFQQVYSLFAGILDAPVRMKYHSFSKRSVPIGHPDDGGMGCIHMIAYGPSDQFAVKKIQHTGQIKKPILTRNIGQVRDTRCHGLILIKFAIQQVWTTL